MSSKSKGQLKKEDRAFLYFQENSKGLLSIKFGPDKYARDTAKFRDMLMLGLGYGLSFFSGLIKDKSILELPQERFMTMALHLSSVEKQSDRLKHAFDLYDRQYKASIIIVAVNLLLPYVMGILSGLIFMLPA